MCRLPDIYPGNPGVSLLSQCQNRSARNGAKIETLYWGEGSKNETRGTIHKWSTEVRGRRGKVIQKWSRKFRDILVLVFNMFPRPFPAEDVVKLTLYRYPKLESTTHQEYLRAVLRCRSRYEQARFFRWWLWGRDDISSKRSWFVEVCVRRCNNVSLPGSRRRWASILNRIKRQMTWARTTDKFLYQRVVGCERIWHRNKTRSVWIFRWCRLSWDVSTERSRTRCDNANPHSRNLMLYCEVRYAEFHVWAACIAACGNHLQLHDTGNVGGFERQFGCKTLSVVQVTAEGRCVPPTPYVSLRIISLSCFSVSAKPARLHGEYLQVGRVREGGRLPLLKVRGRLSDQISLTSQRRHKTERGPAWSFCGPSARYGDKTEKKWVWIDLHTLVCRTLGGSSRAVATPPNFGSNDGPWAVKVIFRI